MRNKMVGCLLESLVYSFLIYLIFFKYLRFGDSFLEMNLHPFVIMVGFIALKYGAYLGLIGSFIATGVYLYTYLSLGNDLGLFFISVDYYKFFLIFLFVNLVLGKFKNIFDEKIEELNNEKHQLSKKYREERDKNLELTILSNKLKNQIVNSRHSLITLYHIKNSLKNKNIEQVYTEIMILFKDFLECESASIYKLVDDKRLVNILSFGNRTLDYSIDFESEIAKQFREVYKSRKPQEYPLNTALKTPIYVAPIFDRDKIIGFINVEKLSFNVKERYTFELFKIIVEELRDAMIEILKRVEVENSKYYIESAPKILQKEYFDSVVAENKRREEILKESYVLLEAKNKGFTPKEISDALSDKIEGNIYITADEKYIQVLFSMTKKEKIDSLILKLKECLKEVDFYEI
ncbi:Uncharacterised protein [Fusobacterium necrogenes]|uniref:GAF domain-containing protein n=1 Tax=Fusobacterium necrogenes TaxID=858 RepID=A0A377GXZ6_9FUSO|nr:hypothetical protein [Fusobacterium necrogenes]STO31796.1 Uncharacterised protein [Fusobacterium necrogenes]